MSGERNRGVYKKEGTLRQEKSREAGRIPIKMDIISERSTRKRKEVEVRKQE